MVKVRNGKVIMLGDKVATRCWCCDPKTPTPTDYFSCVHTPVGFSGAVGCRTPFADTSIPVLSREIPCGPPGGNCAGVTDPWEDVMRADLTSTGFKKDGCELNLQEDFAMEVYARYAPFPCQVDIWMQPNLHLKATVSTITGDLLIGVGVHGSCKLGLLRPTPGEPTLPDPHLSYDVRIFQGPSPGEPTWECINFTVTWTAATRIISFAGGGIPGSSAVMEDLNVWPCCDEALDIGETTPETIVMQGSFLTPQDMIGFMPVYICYGP